MIEHLHRYTLSFFEQTPLVGTLKKKNTQLPQKLSIMSLPQTGVTFEYTPIIYYEHVGANYLCFNLMFLSHETYSHQLPLC